MDDVLPGFGLENCWPWNVPTVLTAGCHSPEPRKLRRPSSHSSRMSLTMNCLRCFPWGNEPSCTRRGCGWALHDFPGAKIVALVGRDQLLSPIAPHGNCFR